MKKKIILLAALSIALPISALVCGLALNSSNTNLAKAADKEFVFDTAVGSNQFDGHYPTEKPAEISVVTGVSSNLETSVRLIEDTDNDYGKYFGDGNYFVRNSKTISATDFVVNIGVNNLTNIEVVYGCIKTKYTIPTELHCYMDVKDDEDVWHNGVSGSSGDVFNSDRLVSWTKSDEEYKVTEVRVRVGVTGGSVYWGEPLYIKTITLNWSC